MKRNKISKIITILFIFILIATNCTYAAKEDLEKEYTEVAGKAADRFRKIFEELDTDDDKKLSMEELGEATDEQINVLAKLGQVAAVYGPLYSRLYTDSSGTIDREYNDRRIKYGLEEDSDTTAGDRAEQSGNKMKKYYPPEKVGSVDTSTKGIDDMIGDAKDFVSSAKGDVGQVKEEPLQSFSSTFYNIFLTAGVAIAVIAGMIIGIKYMLGSVEEKADLKTMLVPYVVGCIVVFGSFGIWKLIILMMESM